MTLHQAAALAFALSCAVLLSASASGADLRLPAPPKPQRQESSPPDSIKRLYEEFLRWRRSLPPRREWPAFRSQVHHLSGLRGPTQAAWSWC